MDAPIPWPASCYPALLRSRYPLLEATPGLRVLRAVLDRYLRDGASVLDIGCGAAIGACHVAASGARHVGYTGIDPDHDACLAARQILASLPRESVAGTIVERTLQAYLATRPPRVDLVLWTFAFHDCLDAADEAAAGAACSAVGALLRADGRLIVMDAGFAPGAAADEIDRTYAYMERIVGHADRGRYFTADALARLFTAAGLTVVERHDAPLVALARYLGFPHARATLLVLTGPRAEDPPA